MAQPADAPEDSNDARAQLDVSVVLAGIHDALVAERQTVDVTKKYDRGGRGSRVAIAVTRSASGSGAYTACAVERLYAYVDETGQDTVGRLFLVAVVIVGNERDDMLAWLEDVEARSRKGITPWRGTEYKRRLEYLDRVLFDPRRHRSVYYAIHGGTNFRDSTIVTIHRAFYERVERGAAYEATAVVDGLRRSETRRFAVDLRHLGLPVKKVRGSRDETNALGRLADAMAGFARDVHEGNEELRGRFERAASAIRRV